MKKASKRKLKVKKSIKRRFTVTKTGKVMRRGSHVRHLIRRKNKGQLREQKVAQEVTGAFKTKIKKALGK